MSTSESHVCVRETRTLTSTTVPEAATTLFEIAVCRSRIDLGTSVAGKVPLFVLKAPTSFEKEPDHAPSEALAWTCRSSAVPHAAAGLTWKAKWSGTVPADAKAARFGHAAAGSDRVTPAVGEDSAPAIEVSAVLLSFRSVTCIVTVSPGSSTPLPELGPPVAQVSVYVAVVGVAW